MESKPLIFISHSSEDQISFRSLYRLLEAKGFRCWLPHNLELGKPLAGQLREAVLLCDACIFIATQRSIKSEWCLAELGAFWGAGKRVIGLTADPDLEENKLPPQMRGDLWTNDVDRILETIEKIHQEVEQEKNKRSEKEQNPKMVTDLSVADFIQLIHQISPASTRPLALNDALKVVRRELLKYYHISPQASDIRLLGTSLKGVLEIEMSIVLSEVRKLWRIPMNVQTETGLWIGGALEEREGTSNYPPAPYADDYEGCIFLFEQNNRCVATTIVKRYRNHYAYPAFFDIISECGSVALGVPKAK